MVGRHGTARRGGTQRTVIAASAGFGGALATTWILPPGPTTLSTMPPEEPAEPVEEPLLSAGVLTVARRPPGAEEALPGRDGDRRLRSPPALPGRIWLTRWLLPYEDEEDRVYAPEAGLESGGGTRGRPWQVPLDQVSIIAGTGSVSGAQLCSRRSLPLSLAMKYMRATSHDDDIHARTTSCVPPFRSSSLAYACTNDSSTISSTSSTHVLVPTSSMNS